ncbi:hypothetical protein YC2023_051486 [Brassica napus]
MCHHDKWVIDSGCSYHMTCRRDWFHMLQEMTSGQVIFGNYCAVGVLGIGTINIKAYGGSVKTLTNVRYIPELRRNLIFNGTLDILGFEHSGGHGKTRFYKHGKLPLLGTGSLNLLDGETVSGEVYCSAMKKLSKDETVLWHRRLGHMSMKNLQILARKGVINKRRIVVLEFRESCLMGKHKRLSFHIGRHDTVKLSGIYMLIYGDLQMRR